MMTCDVPQHRSVEKPVAKERPVIYVWRVRGVSSDITKTWIWRGSRVNFLSPYEEG